MASLKRDLTKVSRAAPSRKGQRDALEFVVSSLDTQWSIWDAMRRRAIRR
jgi:hypothetical protein